MERCEQPDRPVATRARGRGRTGRSEDLIAGLTPGSAHCTGKGWDSLFIVVVYTETLARVIRPTDSTHQPGKPIFSGRYHRRFFAARRARGRDQRAIPRQPVFISRPTYVRPRGCWPRWSQALRIRPLQRGGTRQSRRQGPCICVTIPRHRFGDLGPNPRPSDSPCHCLN